MKKTLNKLTLIYYLIYIAAIVVGISGFQLFRSGYTIDDKSTLGIAISSILIIFIIGSIPITLALFNKKTKKWAEIEDVNEKLKIYEKASIIRLAIVGTGFLLGVLFYFVLYSPQSNSQSMIFCAGIAAIALFFCKPAEVKIISELKIEEPDRY
ncbi:MAG: hypothetical protein Q7J05_03005 [Paludibacter sp.]|nr:hypothetical protein [Paludibacter sp.]